MPEFTKPSLPAVDELLALLPQPAIVEIGGLKIAVPVLTFGAIAKILALTRPILAQAPVARPFGEVVVEHLDTMLEVLAIALNWTPDRVAALPPDAAIQLALAIFEKNVDFFGQCAPRITAEVEKVAARVGQMPSSFSWPMAMRTSLQ
jgi:hypothetical protein